MEPDYIHLMEGWPVFQWDESALLPLLTETRHAQGRLLGRMEGLGFKLRGEADLSVMTAEVVKSSAIEGERLNDREVRSSLARRLGIDIGTPAGCGTRGFDWNQVALFLRNVERLQDVLRAAQETA